MRAALVLLLLCCTAFAESPATALKLTGKEGDLGSRAPAATMIVLNVNAMVVEGVVRQRFRNDTDQFVEATWLQALPANAAVHEFSVAIGERRIVSEVRARPEAQQVYTAARAAGAAAAIVDADHRNGFSTRIANVAPGEWVETELKFDQVLTFSEGLFQLEFPLAIHSKDAQIRAGICESVADTGPNACSAQLRAVDIVVHLNPGLKIDRVEPATHAIDVGYAGDTLEISLKEGPVPDDRDFALTWQPSPSAQPVAALMTETAADGHYALLMVVPPTQPTESIKRELILVIDTSGSMFGDAMTQAKAAAHDALLRLEAGDRFNVIAFSDVTRALYPEPQPASRQKVDEALNFVEAFSADGGTEMVAALERALSGTAPVGYVRQVVFATDGEVEREDALLDLIDARLGASRLFPIGIGAAPNAGFLRQFSVVIGSFGKLIKSPASLKRCLQRSIGRSWQTLTSSCQARTKATRARCPICITASRCWC
jgi:Ca-activated chloride channel homolog